VFPGFLDLFPKNENIMFLFPCGMTFGADNGPIQIKGNVYPTEGPKLLDDQLGIEIDGGFCRIRSKLSQGRRDLGPMRNSSQAHDPTEQRIAPWVISMLKPFRSQKKDYQEDKKDIGGMGIP
jgi:hypothetical protein